MTRSVCLALVLAVVGCADPAPLEVPANETACQRWCRIESSCRVMRGQDSLADDGAFVCGFDDGASFITTCVDSCEDIRVAATPAAVDACLTCLSDEIDATCRGAPGCRSACDPIGDGFDGLLETFEDQYTCWLDDGGPRPDVCPSDNIEFYFSVSVADDPGGSYVGVGGIATVDPISIVLTNGSTLAVRLDGAPTVPLVVGERVDVDFEAHCPFGCYDRLTLRDATGGLLLHAWSGQRFEKVTLPELTTDTARSNCRSDGNFCGHAIPLDIVVTPAGGTATRVGIGQTMDVGAFTVVNGTSEQLFLTYCSDTSEFYSTSAVIRRTR